MVFQNIEFEKPLWFNLNDFANVYLWGHHIDRIIVLTGPKHTGKTTAGRILAGLLEAGFVDLDACIETRTGKSPRTLYREDPGVFRAAETGALRSLAGVPADVSPEGSGMADEAARLVAAAGGGIVDNEEALAILRGPEFRMVYLAVSAETAWDRIRGESEKTGELPPFLNTADPRKTHRELHERRAAAYRALADLTVQGDGKSPEDIAGEIFQNLRCNGIKPCGSRLFR
ncbi:MAG: shikimate kinase [Spirochaetaceae bacterium]|jgi:shikimate kinase|nr:shikimate kinase [Spirochaetaceae bacterium]